MLNSDFYKDIFSTTFALCVKCAAKGYFSPFRGAQIESGPPTVLINVAFNVKIQFPVFLDCFLEADPFSDPCQGQQLDPDPYDNDLDP